MKRGAPVAGALLVLTACIGGGGPAKPSPQAVAMINRALAGAPGAAQPSAIVAAELAFVRAAREQGQWAAFRQFAAPGALLHGANGPLAIDVRLATQADSPIVMQWKPRAVVISCDGALAVSQSRYRDPEGKVGTRLTVWERQPSGEYRLIFHASGDDVPQPPPSKPLEDGNIIVTALDAVTGMIASCPRGGSEIPPPPALALGADGKADARLSRDGTLRWRWEHRADGTRYAKAEYFYEGRWLTALEQSLAPEGDER
jgi:hypothetical protein